MMKNILNRDNKKASLPGTEASMKCLLKQGVNKSKQGLCAFMQVVISQQKTLGKIRTSEIYESTLRSFLRFHGGDDITFDKLDSDIIKLYEAYLQNSCALTRNSSSFYLRVLRAVYNRAVEQQITKDLHPFRHVYTGVDKTVKRALPLNVLRRIKAFDLSATPKLELARDLFLFSFYTRGMSFVDMAYLKRNNLKDGVLVYRRRKTGQTLQIKWEKCMQDIIERHGYGVGDYLLPIIRTEGKDERLQYKSALSSTNLLLKQIGDKLRLSGTLSTYVARHSWASVARCQNVPLPVISECMGHDNEKTTRIYLTSLETSVVDEANDLVIRALLDGDS